MLELCAKYVSRHDFSLHIRMARRWSNLKHGMSSKWFQALWEPQRCILVDKPTGKHTVSAVSAREACSLVCVFVP